MSTFRSQEEALAILLSVSDIDGSHTAKCLEEIAYAYGVMDMRQVFLIVQPYMPFVSKLPAINRSDHFGSVRVLVSLAIINYALYVHKTFDILSIDPGKAVEVNRKARAEVHHEMVMWCMTLINDCIKTDPF